jgi:hypothetical protein
MALEQVFVDPSTLRRFHEGPLASELDGFCEWLSKRGFARSTICGLAGRAGLRDVP